MQFTSLKLKLTVGAIGIGLLILLVQSVVQFWYLRGDLVQRIRGEEVDRAEMLAGHIDETLQMRVDALSAMAVSVPQWQLDNNNVLEGFLQNERSMLALFDDLYIFDAQGRLLVDWPQRPGRRGLDVSDRDYIQAVIRERKPAISAPILGKATKQPIIVIAAPTFDPHGELTAIVGGVLNLGKPNLLGRLSALKVGENGYVQLLSPQREFIAHPDASRILRPLPDEIDPAYARALAGFEGPLEGVDLAGVPGLHAFHRLKTTGWILGTFVPMAEVLEPVEQMRLRMAATTLALMLVVVPLLWGGAAGLLAPLERLAAAMRRRIDDIHQGAHSQPVLLRGSTEINTVTAAFNEFLKARNAAEEALRVSEAQRQLAMDNLVQAKRIAEDASRAKSEFLASMTHELRTPLNAVLGYAQIISMEGGLNEETRQHVREIAAAGKHLLALVNDVIDLARIEAGRLELTPSVVNLGEELANCLAMMAPLAQKHDIALEAKPGDGATTQVMADALRLRQVVTNLLSNAIKYNRPQGRVTLSCEVGGGQAHIAVADTGLGIPAEKQGRLFNDFDRLGWEGSAVEGSGIGLVITRRIVEAMGGKIGFVSVEGEGSTFWVELPLGTPPAEEGGALTPAQG